MKELNTVDLFCGAGGASTGIAIERGDSAARERIGALIDALQQYQDSEPKEEEG